MSGERRLFGTDGIRGRANAHPITAEVALKVGMAAGRYFTRGDHKHKVVIGKDTRRSSYMLESALTAGFTSMGFVGPDGFKLSDDVEDVIEAYMKADMSEFLADPVSMGNHKRLETGRARYIEFAKSTIPRSMNFEGLKIVVDCANGAAYRTAPNMLWELGAEIIPIGVSPNGLNINEGCGSTNTALAQETVVAEKADLARWGCRPRPYHRQYW